MEADHEREGDDELRPFPVGAALLARALSWVLIALFLVLLAGVIVAAAYGAGLVLSWLLGLTPVQALAAVLCAGLGAALVAGVFSLSTDLDTIGELLSEINAAVRGEQGRGVSLSEREREEVVRRLLRALETGKLKDPPRRRGRGR
ncbi:MAG: hypothetical protein ABIP48_28870 [Planctomycetota bacterium]